MLKQAVRHKMERFPPDFMFLLTPEKPENWRSQLVTCNADKLGLRHPPMVFTEQGVAMLSSVLRNHRGVQLQRRKGKARGEDSQATCPDANLIW